MRYERIGNVGPFWHWPKDDYWGWTHPLDHWPGIRDAILAHTPERRRIIQAGGCCGMYPRLFAEHFEQVITFEPDPENFQYLMMNCKGKNIVKIQGALGDRSELKDFVPGKPFNVGLGHLGKADGNTPVFSLDGIIDYPVDAIQLDCEGGEYEAIMGASSTIQSWWPTLCIENPNEQLLSFLTILGYIEVQSVPSMVPDVTDIVFVRK